MLENTKGNLFKKVEEFKSESEKKLRERLEAYDKRIQQYNKERKETPTEVIENVETQKSSDKDNQGTCVEEERVEEKDKKALEKAADQEIEDLDDELENDVDNELIDDIYQMS